MINTIPKRKQTEALPCCLVIGKESVGKSQLISSLIGVHAGESNYRGSTVLVQNYRTSDRIYIDTPGILRKSDTETTRLAISKLNDHETVVLVVQATSLDADLKDMLPLVAGKTGIIIVTFWDKIEASGSKQEVLRTISAELGVPLIPVDARNLTQEQQSRIHSAINSTGPFHKSNITQKTDWIVSPSPSWLDHKVTGSISAIALLLLPALATIWGANLLAEILHPVVAGWFAPLIDWVKSTCPVWATTVLTAQQGEFGYGLLNMGPFLLVWALPTVVLFSLFIGVYKSTGLVDRINTALQPLVAPFGLSGRDVLRVMMGFGCNVPAVIGTRACSSCSRGTAISAIAFGAVCSYQLPATLAVLSATAEKAGYSPAMISICFLSYLLLSSLIYLRLTAPRQSRDSLNILVLPERSFLQWPSINSIVREARGTIHQFFMQAIPVFLLICIVASILTQSGLMKLGSEFLSPVMQLFNLPADTALVILLSSMRKDGIFLLASDSPSALSLTIPQILTAVYLAGVLLPCLVTVLTIGREISWKRTGKMLIRQAVAAVAFALILAWGSDWFL